MNYLKIIVCVLILLILFLSMKKELFIGTPQEQNQCRNCKKKENILGLNMFCKKCESENLDLKYCTTNKSNNFYKKPTLSDSNNIAEHEKEVNMIRLKNFHCIPKNIEHSDKYCKGVSNNSCELFSKNSDKRYISKHTGEAKAGYMNDICGDDYYCAYDQTDHCGSAGGTLCSPTNIGNTIKINHKTVKLPDNNKFESQYGDCVCGTPKSELNKPKNEQIHYICSDLDCTKMESKDININIKKLTPNLTRFYGGHNSYMDI